MGIPKCGGMHGIRSENLCFECQQLTLMEKQTEQYKRYADLLEEQLELEFRGMRRPRRQAPPEPQQRQKEIIVKGGIDVRARRPSTDT